MLGVLRSVLLGILLLLRCVSGICRLTIRCGRLADWRRGRRLARSSGRRLTRRVGLVGRLGAGIGGVTGSRGRLSVSLLLGILRGIFLLRRRVTRGVAGGGRRRRLMVLLRRPGLVVLLRCSRLMILLRVLLRLLVLLCVLRRRGAGIRARCRVRRRAHDVRARIADGTALPA